MSGILFNSVRGIRPPYCHRQGSRRSCPPPGSSTKHKEGGYKVYKLLTFLVGFPAIGAAAANVYIRKSSKEECRPPFVKHEYLRRHTKRWPWGDGTRSAFHNPKVNPLPDGYEDEE